MKIKKLFFHTLQFTGINIFKCSWERWGLQPSQFEECTVINVPLVPFWNHLSQPSFKRGLSLRHACLEATIRQNVAITLSLCVPGAGRQRLDWAVCNETRPPHPPPPPPAPQGQRIHLHGESRQPRDFPWVLPLYFYLTGSQGLDEGSGSLLISAQMQSPLYPLRLWLKWGGGCCLGFSVQ